MQVKGFFSVIVLLCIYDGGGGWTISSGNPAENPLAAKTDDGKGGGKVLSRKNTTLKCVCARYYPKRNILQELCSKSTIGPRN